MNNDNYSQYNFISNVNAGQILPPKWGIQIPISYTFSKEITKKLVEHFPKNIIGMKDSTGNLWNNFKSQNFSMFVGSEKLLLDNLKIGGAGCISATTNITGTIAKKVFDDFKKTRNSKDIEKLNKIRTAFDETGNLISAVHTFKVLENSSFKNLLPPLELLSEEKKNQMLKKLKELNFINEKNQAA